MVEINLRENKDSFLRRIGKRLPTSADMLESPDEFLVLVNVPGCEEDEIDLRFVKGSLKVSAERNESHEGYVPVRESRPRKINETVPIPDDVDAGAATATYRNGVLRIELPKLGEGEEAEDRDEYDQVDVSRTEADVSADTDDESDEADEDDAEAEDEAEADDEDDDLPTSRDELDELSYRDLQGVAKEVGVKANLKKDEMKDKIADELDL